MDGPAERRVDARAGLATFSGRALGSVLRLFVRQPAGPDATASGATAEAAWAAVQGEFAAVDAALSRFRDDSELTALNRRAGTGGVALVSWRLRTMLAAVDRAARITDGRFDASVLDALEQIGERGATLAGAPLGWAPVGERAPSSRAPGPTTARDGLANDRVQVVAPGTPRASLVEIPARPIDSGGIGKGLALRWASAAAIAALPEGAGLLIDAGGDISSAGAPPSGGWRIGVDDPVAPAGPAPAPLAVYALDAGGVSTSSVAVRHWTGPDGRLVHHLVDPRTRQPARTGLIAVSVAGPDPAWNEVWSKALFLGGSEAIGEEGRRRGLPVWWVTDRGRLGMTPEARARSVWVAEERVE